MKRRKSTRLALCLFAFVLVAAACGSKGPDLRAAVGKVDAVTGTSTGGALGVNVIEADAVWGATGSPTAVADAIAAVETPGERTDDAGGDVYLLYRSGTIWVTPSTTDATQTAVVLYDDNDRAYNRHNVILIRNSRWGTSVNNYRSSSSGNGFRGGGSSSGKN